MADNDTNLSNAAKKTLGAMACQYSIKPPDAFWLSHSQWEVFFYHLKGRGLDVDDGFAFRGIPVKQFND